MESRQFIGRKMTKKVHKWYYLLSIITILPFFLAANRFIRFLCPLAGTVLLS